VTKTHSGEVPIIPKDQLRKLMKKYNLKGTEDIQSMLRDMFGDATQEMFEFLKNIRKFNLG